MPNDEQHTNVDTPKRKLTIKELEAVLGRSIDDFEVNRTHAVERGEDPEVSFVKHGRRWFEK